MKRDILDELPFIVGGMAFEIGPQMGDPARGEMVGPPSLAQPGRALAGKDIVALGFTGIKGRGRKLEIAREGTTGHIMEIDRAGFAALGAQNGNGAGPGIEYTLIT